MTDLHESSEWPLPHRIDNSIGQIAGVSISKDNFVYIFHRGDREWNQTTFFDNNVYRETNTGPISGHTVVVLDPKNGSVIRKWGNHRYNGVISNINYYNKDSLQIVFDTDFICLMALLLITKIMFG